MKSQESTDIVALRSESRPVCLGTTDRSDGDRRGPRRQSDASLRLARTRIGSGRRAHVGRQPTLNWSGASQRDQATVNSCRQAGDWSRSRILHRESPLPHSHRMRASPAAARSLSQRTRTRRPPERDWVPRRACVCGKAAAPVARSSSMTERPMSLASVTACAWLRRSAPATRVLLQK